MDENNGSSEKPKLRLTRPDEPNPATAEPPKEPAEAVSGTTGKAFAPILKRPAPKPPAEAVREEPLSPFQTPTPPPPPAVAPPPVDAVPPAPVPPPSPAPAPEPLAAATAEPAAPDPIEGPEESRGPWLSIVVIAALLFLLAGSGLGIWWVLRPPSPASSGTPAPETPAEPVNKGPVGKAREAIAAAQENAVPAELLASGTTPAAPEPAPLSGPGPEAVAGTLPAPAQPAEATDLSANTEAVTRYLENVFIGAVGGVASNPRAMIDGKNYTKGDMVNESLGLRFVDVDGGTLYFKDSNDVIYVKRF